MLVTRLPRKKQEPAEVPQYIRSLKKDVDKRLTDIKAEMDEVQKKAGKALEEQPLLVLGVAFIAGMALGIMIANAGD